MIFPVVLKTDDFSEPPEALYYLVAADGLYQVRRTETYRAVTRARGEVPGLRREREDLEFSWPRLPATVLQEVLDFFLEIYRRLGSEAIVILFYDPQRQRFRADAPPQTVSGWEDAQGVWTASLRLDYGSVERPAGWLRFGTVHSHANLPAYASHVDCDDEQWEDGLHVVYGHLNRRVPSVSACFVANGARFPLVADEVLEPVTTSDAAGARADWLERVERKTTASPWTSSSWGESWTRSR